MKGWQKGGIVDWDILLESRDDKDDFKAILGDFKTKCQKMKIWDYVTKSISVIGIKEITMCINFGANNDQLY